VVVMGWGGEKDDDDNVGMRKQECLMEARSIFYD
jgi:hypothetical protein